MQEADATGVTPVQYAALQKVASQPGIAERSLLPGDKRVRLLTLSAEGEAVLAQMQPATRHAQDRILAPLDKADRATFMRLLRTLVSENNELSRAPRQ